MIATALAWIAGNRWAVAVAFLAMLAGFWAIEESRVSAAKSDASTARAEVAAIKEEAATAARLASEHYRAEEQRRSAQQRENADEAERLSNRSRAAVAGAAVSDGGLRSAARVIASGCRTAQGTGAPASGPADRLADVLAESTERYRAVAAAADRAIIAGQLCVRDYESLTP